MNQLEFSPVMQARNYISLSAEQMRRQRDREMDRGTKIKRQLRIEPI